jgi:hypothetical protein
MGGKGSGRKRQLLPCGTSAAYQRHRKRGETCLVCKAAHAKDKKTTYRSKTGSRGRSEQSRIKGRIAIIEEKLRRGSCLDCGMEVTRENYFCFDFDHRDPAEKSFTVSKKQKDVAESVLHAEFAKCDLVCANCHRMRTHKQFKTGVLTGMKATHKKKNLPPTLFDIAN